MSNFIEIYFTGKCLERVYQRRSDVLFAIEHLCLKICHLLVLDLEQHLAA